MDSSLASVQRIGHFIFIVRGEKVVIDRDLASLYQVPTKALNQAVKRNADRFPANFMVRLTKAEVAELVTKCDRFSSLKHSGVAPAAFTEHGVAMLSSVLRSPRAIRVNIEIIQAFIALRRYALEREEVGRKIEALERRLSGHDATIASILETIEQLVAPPAMPARRIGFRR